MTTATTTASTTYLLIHGAYQGGWIWRDVAASLRAAGHHVLAPSLDGCAERRHELRPGITTETQADELAAMLFYEDLHNVVLVGTSSGGMVLCRTAELARERIGRVVFADALALFDGEAIGDIVTRRTTSLTTDLSTGPSPEDAAGRLFAGLDPATRDWALAGSRPANSRPAAIPPPATGRWRATRCTRSPACSPRSTWTASGTKPGRRP